MDNQPDQDQQEQALLESQLRESVAAEHFFETASGKIIVDILTKEITRLTRLIASDKYLKDHNGYVIAVCELKANQTLLKKLQVAASPIRRGKIQERLDEAENGQ